MDWILVLGAIVACVIAISALQYRAARGQYRPLASRQPTRPAEQTPELGMEAIDMTQIRRTQRSNDSLERVNNIWTKRGSLTSDVSTCVDAMPDDETYARRYHAAFHKKNKD
jgi:hypothetical protein